MKMNSHKQTFDSVKCGFASFVSTYVAGIMHPLDVVKTRFQSHDGKINSNNLVPKYSGIFKALKKIYKYQGLRGLYKGFYVSLFSQAAATGLFFWAYEARKRIYQLSGKQTMDAVTRASIDASIFATLITQPFWVIKTRMLLNITPGQRQIPHAIQKTKQIYRQDGMRGFGKGLILSLLLSFSGVAQMYIYQGSKLVYYSLNLPTANVSEQNFICGSLSKFISILLTYPITTARTRIQQNQYIHDSKQAKYKNIRQVLHTLIKYEGPTGFYKGLCANLLKGIPQRGIYFYCYQKLKVLLIPQDNKLNKQI